MAPNDQTNQVQRTLLSGGQKLFPEDPGVFLEETVLLNGWRKVFKLCSTEKNVLAVCWMDDDGKPVYKLRPLPAVPNSTPSIKVTQ